MKEPSLHAIRQYLGKSLKSFTPKELDREALKIWKEEKKKYEQYCLKLEEEKKRNDKEIKENVDRYRKAARETRTLQYPFNGFQ